MLTHTVNYKNSYGNLIIDSHNLIKRAKFWVSNLKSSMYVPCVSCYFYSDQKQTVPSKIGGRVRLYPIFKNLITHERPNIYICEKCLDVEDDEFLEFVIDLKTGDQ